MDQRLRVAIAEGKEANGLVAAGLRTQELWWVKGFGILGGLGGLEQAAISLNLNLSEPTECPASVV